MKSLLLKLYQTGKWLMLIALLLFALINVGGRLLLVNAELFRGPIEQQLDDYGIRGVALDNLSARWEGLQPVVTIGGGSLSIPGRSHALSVSSLELRIKLGASLLRGELVLESFYSHITKLVMVRDKKGDWWLNDIPLTARDSLISALDIYLFFQRLPTFVDIDIGLIQLRDLRQGVDYLIQQGHLRSSRKQTELSLELNARLPSTLGEQFHLVLKGDAARQRLFVDAEQLNLRQLLQLTLVQKHSLRQARLDFRAWADFDKFKILNITSAATVSDLAFDGSPTDPASYGFSLLQTARHNKQGWTVSSRLNDVVQGTQPLGDYEIELALAAGSHQPQLWLNHIDLSVLRSLLDQLDLQQPFIDDMIASKATGRLENLVLQLDPDDFRQSLLGVDFTGLSLQQTETLPGVNPLDGRLLLQQGRAAMTVQADQLTLDFGDMFRAPLRLGRASATAYARFDADAWQLQVQNLELTSKVANVSARLWMEMQKTGEPYLFIRSQYQDADVSAVSRYLPVGIMPAGVVKWLDQSILAGQIKQGDFVFHGRLQNPARLARERAGLLLASFDANNPRIDYLPGWPVIGGGHGHVDFRNAGLKLQFYDSKLAQSRIAQIDLAIADFNRAGIEIKAQAHTPAATLVDTLQQLPSLQMIDVFTRQTQRISGQVDSRLHLEIPLADDYPQPLRVQASAKLQDVTISAPQWMIELEQLNGKININNERISASNLSALYYGDRINIAISPDPKALRTELDVSGRIKTQSLLQLAPDFLRQPVAGVSDWNASVSLAHNPSSQNPLLKVSAHSALQGSVLNFPKPFAKSGDTHQLLGFDAELIPEMRFDFKLDMPGKLKARGRIDLSDDRQPLQFLTIGLQDEDELAPVDQGITIAGHADELDVAEWSSYIKSFLTPADDDAEPFLQQINSLDLKLDRLWLGKQQAQQANIKVYNNGETLKGNIDSTLTAGSFTLPYRMNVLNPLVAKLKFIKLEKASSSQKFEPQIDDMPNLLIQSDKVSWQNMAVYDFVLSTRNEGNTFVIEQLDFARDQVQLKSSGHWEYQPVGDEHVSVFNIAIKGRNFGKVVKGLGLGETIKGGKVDFNGQIGWGGALFNINWPTLIGEVELSLKDGYLKNVDPGAGRFVGLLSFSALPKRLFLDFGDVVKEGMQFDSIKGRFTIHGETMYTDNASLDSVSATVRIKGETNLRRQTYDQTMIITPKIGDTLPVLGALTAGNAVGWGILLLQKIFKKPIDKSVQIEYKVSGSWDDPKIDLVAEKKLKSPNEEEDSYDSAY